MTESPAAPRSWGKKLLLLAALAALAVVGAELLLRSSAAPRDAGGYGAAPSLEQRVAAVPAKQPGDLRVLALGDELTAYDEPGPGGWVRVLEARARADGAAPQVYNLAQDDTGLPHYLSNLDDFGARVQPDLVVFGLSLTDDVLAYELALAREAKGLGATPVRTRGRSEGPAGLAAYSALARWVGRALEGDEAKLTRFARHLAYLAESYGVSAADAEQKWRAHDADLVALAEGGDIDPAALAHGLLRPSGYADLLSVKGGSRAPAALARLLADVERGEALCARLNAACVWVLLPTGLQIDERYHPRFRDLGFVTAPWMARPTPLMAQLLPAMKGKGAFVVDALPALQAPGERDLLRPRDTRLNEEGQRRVGDAVYEALRDAGGLQGRLRPAAAAGGDDDALDARLGELLKGSGLEGATEDERRLAVKIAALHKLRDEMKAVLTSLPAQKATAERMQAELVLLEKALDPAAVKRVLAEAEERFQREGAAEGTLLARARGVDAELARLLEKEPAAADDPDTVKALKAELAKQQAGTAALGAGTAVAFRALRMIEQMKLALPELRKLKASAKRP